MLSRSRVNPVKQITIPRLELAAAATAVRLNYSIVNHLEYKVNQVFYWTDSMTVLRYLKNETTRFLTYVAHRVSFIREATNLNQWKFVPTKLNPADDASRGLSAKALIDSPTWSFRPIFLKQEADEWPEQPEEMSLSKDDPEIKKTNVMVTNEDTNVLGKLMSKYSKWTRLKKTVAWILLAIHGLRRWSQLRKSLKDENAHLDPAKRKQHVDAVMSQKKNEALKNCNEAVKEIQLTPALLTEAEEVICRIEQGTYLKADIQQISQGQPLSRTSQLYRLDPFEQDSLLRVGGRLQRSDLPFETRHPIIVPSQSPIAALILLEAHESQGHLGRNSILAKVRKRYWIIKASPQIRQLLSKCVPCRRYHSRCMNQKMADLPQERTVASQTPFSTVGMDYFGPFLVKRGRASVKRYGVIFTCFTTRAVHLEVAASLDTSSCINAIRRFTSRRGPVTAIWSDNGTNLVGAEREMREQLEQLEQSKLSDLLLIQKIEWHFNPPAASHFGGVWERMIKMVRKVLYGLMQTKSGNLDDEQLSTLLCEVEAVVNSRPITTVSEDPIDLQVLTPNHLLLMKGGHQSVTATSKDDVYARRRWRYIQHLADEFWKRWSREYLTLMQERQKWVKPQRNIRIGDVVLLVDSSPRNAWAMGRVEEVIADKQGFARIARVKTQNSVLSRPIHKLVLILKSD